MLKMRFQDRDSACGSVSDSVNIRVDTIPCVRYCDSVASSTRINAREGEDLSVGHVYD